MAPAPSSLKGAPKEETRFKTMVLSLTAGSLDKAVWLCEPDSLAWRRYQ